jgi:hypothetical protein
VKIRVIDDQGNVSEKTIEEIWADSRNSPTIASPDEIVHRTRRGVELSLDMPKVFRDVERWKRGDSRRVEKIRGYLGRTCHIRRGGLYVLISIAKNQIGKVERDFSSRLVSIS